MGRREVIGRREGKGGDRGEGYRGREREVDDLQVGIDRHTRLHNYDKSYSVLILSLHGEQDT